MIRLNPWLVASLFGGIALFDAGITVWRNGLGLFAIESLAVLSGSLLSVAFVAALAKGLTFAARRWTGRSFHWEFYQLLVPVAALYLLGYLHWDVFSQTSMFSLVGILGTAGVLAAAFVGGPRLLGRLEGVDGAGWKLPVAIGGMIGVWVLGIGARGVLLSVQDRTPDDRQAPRSNIVLFLVDTLRWDAFGSYGSPRPLTPTLDELARRSLQIDQARTPMPLTAPAFMSLLTGTMPHEHGIVMNGIPYRDEAPPTLPERLAAEGYFTGAIVSGFPLRDSLLNVANRFDLYFEHVSSTPLLPNALGDLFWIRLLDRLRLFPLGNLVERRAEVTADVFSRFLRNQPRRPFFMIVHFYDNHTPYEPPESDRRRLSTGDRESYVPFLEQTPPEDLTEPARQEIRDLYWAETIAVDRAIARCLRRLEDQDLLDNTVIIVTADHGEALGEEDYYFDHGLSVHDSSSRVPLLVALPDVDGRVDGTTNTDLTQIQDLILGISAGEVASADEVAEHLHQPWTFQTTSPLQAGAGGAYDVAVTSGSARYIMTRENLTRRDLVLYPGETRESPITQADQGAPVDDLVSLRKAMGAYAATKLQLSGDQEAAMRSLGYLD